MICRHCSTPLDISFLDLGSAPLSNAYLAESDLPQPETFYPLRVRVCPACWLVQTVDCVNAAKVFDAQYAYFSSTSSTWRDHAATYVAMITARLGLSRESFVLEVAANDGYLLRNFLTRGIPCLGIEPTASTADEAERLGIPVRREFFCESLGLSIAAHRPADLIIGNNVYAHVPNINDFTRGLAAALAQCGTITLEFPHLLRLIERLQFDTVYHEHFSYLSLHVVSRIFQSCGLRIWDVEELPTHGGSLRIYGCHTGDPRQTEKRVDKLLAEEDRRGVTSPATYEGFQVRAERVKDNFLEFLIAEKRLGRSVAAYGAAAKGNTLLNFAGIRSDLLPYVCDAAAAKQGRWMPGSRIPILHPSELQLRRPQVVVILPWNIAHEVVAQNAALLASGTRFVVAVPEISQVK